MTQVSNGYGGVVQYSYNVSQTVNGVTTTSRYRDYFDQVGSSGCQSQWQFVTSKSVQDGLGQTFTTNYQYGVGPQAGPFGGWSNEHENWGNNSQSGTYPEWRGFNLVAEIDQSSGNVIEHRFGRGTFLATPNPTLTRGDGTTLSDAAWLKGKEYETRWFESVAAFNNFSGTTPTGTTETTWQNATTTLYKPQSLPSSDYQDWNVYVPYRAQVQKNRGSAYLLQTFTYDFLQSGTPYGNLTDIKEYDTTPSSGAWKRHTKRYYYPGDNTANFDGATAPTSDQYVVDRVAAEDIFSYDGSADGSLKFGTWYCYDGSYSYTAPIGSGQYGDDTSYHGLLTAVRRWCKENGQFLDTTYTYDQYGNRLSETTWNGWGSSTALASGDNRQTTTTYETTYNTFPYQVTDPKGYVTTYNYDLKLGTLLWKSDPNGAKTTYQYDGFGRVVAIWAPLDDASQLGAATILVSYQMILNQPFRVQIGRRKDAGGSLFAKRAYEWRFYDGRGKLVQTQTDFDRSHVPIRAQDLNEVRNGVLKYTTTQTNQVTAGASIIKASDFNGLEVSLQTLWTNQKLGSLTAWSGGWNTAWSSGVTPGGPSWGTGKTPIYGSDLVDLRQWLNAYELAVPVTQTSFTNNAGMVRVVNRFYGGRGLLQGESVPHSLSLPVCGQYQAADRASSGIPQTTYQYDALKRPTNRTQPDPTSQFRWTYDGFTTTAIDENNHQKVTTTDALGRTLSTPI